MDGRQIEAVAGRGRIIVMTGGGTATSFPNGSGYATSKPGLLRFAECVADTLKGSVLLVFAMDRASCGPP